MVNIPLVTFNKGEITPLADARTDVDFYQGGCRHLDNYIPVIYGAAVRRPGLKFVYDSTAAIGGTNMSFSDYLENKILDHIFKSPTSAYTAPTTMYLALSTTAPGDDGADKTEPVSMGYTRKAMTAASWGAAAGGVITNSAVVTYDPSTGTWGVITHYVLMDASSAGNVLAIGELDAPKLIEEGDILTFAIGSITITLD